MDKRNSIAFIFNLAAYNIVAKLLFLNNIIVFIINCGIAFILFFNRIQIYNFYQTNHLPANKINKQEDGAWLLFFGNFNF